MPPKEEPQHGKDSAQSWQQQVEVPSRSFVRGPAHRLKQRIVYDLVVHSDDMRPVHHGFHTAPPDNASDGRPGWTQWQAACKTVAAYEAVISVFRETHTTVGDAGHGTFLAQ